MSIGSRIKEQRKKLGLTQHELALKIGLSLDMVKKLEIDKANPSIETLEKLSDLFNCSTDYLLERNNPEEEIINVFNKLSDKDKEYVIELIKKIKYCR